MSKTDRIPHEELMRRLHSMAMAALDYYPLNPASTVSLINHSENTTYRVDDPDSGGVAALRLHREDYHSANAIACELAWMAALRDTAGIITPVPIPGKDGELVKSVSITQLPRPRNCVLFEFLPGAEPDENNLVDSFEGLGAITAKIHNHSIGWTRPTDYERLHWDFDHLIGKTPYWGDWTQAPALDAERINLLEDLVAMIRERLEIYGLKSDRFGLIHADMRLANLLIDGLETKVIDFDDCGLGWFLYDFATALSFMEDRTDVQELIRSWVTGYTRQRPLNPQDMAEIPTFLMLRRMAIMAWIGSHGETDLARELGPEYTVGTCTLAKRYVASDGGTIGG